MEIQEKTVTIRKSLYDELMEESRWLAALEAAGLDNWEGVSFAREILEEREEPEN